MKCGLTSIPVMAFNYNNKVSFKGNNASSKDSVTISDSAKQRQNVARQLRGAKIDEQSIQSFVKNPDKVARYMDATSKGGKLHDRIAKEMEETFAQDRTPTPVEAYTIADLGFDNYQSIIYIIAKDQYSKLSPDDAQKEAIAYTQNDLQYLFGSLETKYSCKDVLPSKLIEHSQKTGLDLLQSFFAMRKDLSESEIELYKKYMEARIEYPQVSSLDFNDVDLDLEQAMSFYEETADIANTDAQEEIELWTSDELDENGNYKSGLIRPLTLEEAVEAEVQKNSFSEDISIDRLNRCLEFIKENPQYDFIDTLIDDFAM